MATARLKTLLLFQGHFLRDRMVPPAQETDERENQGLRHVLALAQEE